MRIRSRILLTTSLTALVLLSVAAAAMAQSSGAAYDPSPETGPAVPLGWIVAAGVALVAAGLVMRRKARTD